MGSVLYIVIGAYLILIITGLNKLRAQTPPLQTENTISIVDQSCKTINNTIGICIEFLKCPVYESCGDEDGCDRDIADYMLTSPCKINNLTSQLFCCPTTTTTRIINHVDARKTIKLLPIPIDECGVEADFADRIYNGEKTEIGEFPWMTLIIYGENIQINVNTTNEAISRNTSDTISQVFKCGGTLINQRYILTAAHCVAGRVLNKYTPQSVRLGEYDLSSKIDCQENQKLCADPPIDIEIENIFVHAKFNRQSKISNFDIALIRLKENVNSTKFIKPICLPSQEDEDEAEVEVEDEEEDDGEDDVDVENNSDNYDNINNFDKFVVTGWGSTENGTFSNIKLKATISLTNPNRCKQIYQNHGAFQNQLCGLGDNGADSCSGDSGGGLMGIKKLRNFQQYWYIIGIVSFGPNPCGRINIPGAYTPVNKYMKWILEHLKP